MISIEVAAMTLFILVADALPMVAWGTLMDAPGLAFCNPCWLYKKKELSVFSCVFVAVFANISILPYALGHWFYKACSTRRR